MDNSKSNDFSVTDPFFIDCQNQNKYSGLDHLFYQNFESTIFTNCTAMAFTKDELKQWEPVIATFVEEKRPREEIRSQVDLDYSIDIDDQSIEIFEIRPHFSKNEKIKIPIAKTKWVRRQQVWKIYWQRADMEWHKYDPLPQVETLEEFINEVKEDPLACFWG